MIYDYPNGYAHGHTADTVKRLNDPKRGAGRVKVRYDVFLRDGNMTIVHSNLTLKELHAVDEEIKRQHNIMW
jgi:uncharacterized beta-barrel protein YwiB (DUF1934 family)